MKTILRTGLLVLSLANLPFAYSAASAPRPFAVVALPNPRAVAVDRAGNLYVGDVDLDKVYRITPAGVVSVLGAGGPTITDPIGIAVAANGSVYVSDADANTIYRIAPNGSVTLPGKPSPTPGDTSLAAPTSIAMDASGNAFITNNGGNSILKLTPQGVASVVAGKPGATGSADGTATSARFAKPRGIAIDASGNLYVSDETNSNIRKITPSGVVTTLAGTAGSPGSADGSGTAARFGAPRALTVDSAGNVYVADTDNHIIRKVTLAGVVTTLAGRAGERGKTDGPAKSARFSEPRGIAADAAGNLYIADTGNASIRLITSEGTVTTIAAGTKP